MILIVICFAGATVSAIEKRHFPGHIGGIYLTRNGMSQKQNKTNNKEPHSQMVIQVVIEPRGLASIQNSWREKWQVQQQNG
ncbi:hypothetical protein J3E71DRAFT_301668 [Bipolaris maydis]|nr:hypothetical protein J3E71DRAFT_301668 [Bipolaris maydis]